MLAGMHACMQIIAPYAHWDIPAIGQAYVLFRAHLTQPVAFSPGPESLETALFAPEDIPFDELAFSSVSLALRFYLQVRMCRHASAPAPAPGAKLPCCCGGQMICAPLLLCTRGVGMLGVRW